MTMRSCPSAVSHFALLPASAPPPMIGRPCLIFLRKRLRISVLVSGIMLLRLPQVLQKTRHAPLGEGRIVDVAVHFDHRDVLTQCRLQSIEQGLVSFRPPKRAFR